MFSGKVSSFSHQLLLSFIFYQDNEEGGEFDLVLSICYQVGVPLLISLCLVGFTLNLIILVSMVCSQYLMRGSDVYICLITSLVSSDALSSLFMGTQLLCGSYLPVVKEVLPPSCLLIVMEGMRLSIILTTVLHLVLMVTLHTSAIVWPVKGKKFFTKKLVLMIVR